LPTTKVAKNTMPKNKNTSIKIIELHRI